jgi:hypothetical protein|tara:strand:+ start:1037 stop:1309 length:273 start_codon:yes stop_codon:yes gene_type:complete
MDLFERLGMSIGGKSVEQSIDELRVRDDAKRIEELHGVPDGIEDLKPYNVIVELGINAYNKEEAEDIANDAISLDSGDHGIEYIRILGIK